MDISNLRFLELNLSLGLLSLSDKYPLSTLVPFTHTLLIFSLLAKSAHDQTAHREPFRNVVYLNKLSARVEAFSLSFWVNSRTTLADGIAFVVIYYIQN